MSKLLRKSNETLLYEAINRGDIKVVQQHLDKEVNINAQNGDGYTPFHTSCVQQNFQIVDLLLNNSYMRIDTSLKTRTGDSALFLVLTGYYDQHTAKVVQRLIEYDMRLVETADAKGFTPLQAASRWEQIEVLKVLIDIGKAKVNRTDGEGYTALHHSVELRPNFKVIDYLINVGNIDVSIKNSRFWTAFDLMLFKHVNPQYAPSGFIQCIDLLADACLHKENYHSLSTVLNYFLHCIMFNRRELIPKLLEDFFNENVNSKFPVLDKFIRVFNPQDKPMFYAFCMLIHPRVNQVYHFNFKHFTSIFPIILHEAIQSDDKLESLLECIGVIREVLEKSLDKNIIPAISELDYNPTCVGDVRRLFRLYEGMMRLNYKIDFNGIASRHFMNVLNDASVQNLKHLEIILAFCTDNFINLDQFCDTFNVKLNETATMLTYQAELPLEMKGSGYLATLKELARKVIRAAIYDQLLKTASRMWIPADKDYKNKTYVHDIQSLGLPTVLQRYLRFMDRLPIM